MKELVLNEFKQTVNMEWFYFLEYLAEEKEIQYKLWTSKCDIKYILRELLISDGMTPEELDTIEDEIKAQALKAYK